MYIQTSPKFGRKSFFSRSMRGDMSSEISNDVKYDYVNGLYTLLGAPYTGVVTEGDYYGKREVHIVGGLVHRDDGPSIIFENGSVEYYVLDLCHRVDGPAVIHKDEDGSIHEEFWFHDRRYEFKEWLGLAWEHMSEEKKKEYIYAGFQST